MDLDDAHSTQTVANQPESQMPSFVDLRFAIEVGYDVAVDRLMAEASMEEFSSVAALETKHPLVLWAFEQGGEQAARHYWQQEME